jgi:hypothetical protein
MHHSYKIDNLINKTDDSHFFNKVKEELTQRYNVEETLASEMAWDLIEVLYAVDSDVEIFEKYFLVS